MRLRIPIYITSQDRQRLEALFLEAAASDSRQQGITISFV